jgi:hypothetical protein
MQSRICLQWIASVVCVCALDERRVAIAADVSDDMIRGAKEDADQAKEEFDRAQMKFERARLDVSKRKEVRDSARIAYRTAKEKLKIIVAVERHACKPINTTSVRSSDVKITECDVRVALRFIKWRLNLGVKCSDDMDCRAASIRVIAWCFACFSHIAKWI